MTNYQKFTMVEIDRNMLKDAPYNPRVMEDENKHKLKNAIKNVGLVQPIVWNKRSGNIVGGHQRVGILDDLEKNQNYKLMVSAIDVDEKTEKELNILLNNPEAQGDWDLEKLQSLIPECDLTNTGFDLADVYQLLGQNPDTLDNDGVIAMAETLHNLRETANKLSCFSEKVPEGQDYYNVVVFRGAKEREEFCKLIGQEDNRFIDGRSLHAFLEKAKSNSGTISPVLE